MDSIIQELHKFEELLISDLNSNDRFYLHCRTQQNYKGIFHCEALFVEDGCYSWMVISKRDCSKNEKIPEFSFNEKNIMKLSLQEIKDLLQTIDIKVHDRRKSQLVQRLLQNKELFLSKQAMFIKDTIN